MTTTMDMTFTPTKRKPGKFIPKLEVTRTGENPLKFSGDRYYTAEECIALAGDVKGLDAFNAVPPEVAKEPDKSE